MIYNGHGDVLPPIVIHNGQISKTAEDFFIPRLSFVNSGNGKMNYDVSVRAIETIVGCVCFF